MTLTVGDQAPAISAPNQDGVIVDLDFETPTVLYFYPRDDTSGCTTEAREFNEELDTYRAAGLTVYGVSTDDVDSHADFASEYGLEFDLLADPDGEIARQFAVPVDRGAAARTTYVLADSVVKSVYTGVDPSGHAREVFMDLIDDGLIDALW